MADFEKLNVSDYTKEVVRRDVSSIIIDTKRVHGQIRPLKESYVQALMTRMQQQSPTVMFGCLAWQHEGTTSSQCSHRTDGRVYCLGGQHYISACQRLQVRLASQGCPVPEFIDSCNCTILWTKTSLEVRIRLAGLHQAGQRGCDPMTWSSASKLLLQMRHITGSNPDEPFGINDYDDNALFMALQGAGLLQGDEKNEKTGEVCKVWCTAQLSAIFSTERRHHQKTKEVVLQ